MHYLLAGEHLVVLHRDGLDVALASEKGAGMYGQFS